MKQTNKTIYTIFLLSIIAVVGSISVANASITAAQDKAVSFIENVLPFDSAQYNITLRSYGVPKMPDGDSTQPINGEQEVLTYSLESKDSAIDVICTIENNAVSMVNAYVVKAPAISNRSYGNLIDAATGFLQNYQSCSALDSTKMIDMLSKVNSIENTTTTLDNLRLNVTHLDLTGTFFGDSVDFRWVQTTNGCDYLLLAVSFKDGVFSGLIDRRAVYTIGDTSVNISKDEAIKIAMDAIKNYSYRMTDDWVVTDFDVIENKADATLQPLAKESNVLYPIWTVILPLNGTYPGSVTELLVQMWAGTGEIHLVHHQAYGGSEFPSDTNELSGSEITATPSSETSNDNKAPLDMGMATILVVVTIAIIALAITLVFKRRSR